MFKKRGKQLLKQLLGRILCVCDFLGEGGEAGLVFFYGLIK